MTDLESTFDTPTDWCGTPLPDDVVAHPLLDADAWAALRDAGRPPSDTSPAVTSYQARAEFLTGAWIIDRVVPSRFGYTLTTHLQPQMLRTADMLGAGRFMNAVFEPRRSAKTTSLWCVLLGRCWMQPQYMAGYTVLTLAKKAAERFRIDVRDPIERRWPDKHDRPLKVNESNGSLGIAFPNGSHLNVLAPKGDDIRSGGYDVLVCDEAGEAEPDMWDDITGAVVPSFDTRPGAQLIYAGTAGKYRDGSDFWQTLHDDGAGRLAWRVADDIDPARLESWDAGVGALIKALHPGLDGLTNIGVIRRSFATLGPAKFAREYLGHFGTAAGNDTIIPDADWADTAETGQPPAGVEPVALALAVHPGGLWASVAVAWPLDPDAGDLAAAAWALDDDAGTLGTPPRVAVKIIHHQAGTVGVARAAYRYARSLHLPIIYDDGNPQERAVMQDLNRARPRPQVRPLKFAEKGLAHTRFLNGLREHTIAHWEQAPLDAAAAGAVRRMSGKTVLLGAPADVPEFDLSPLEAVAAAAYAVADAPATVTRQPIMIS